MADITIPRVDYRDELVTQVVANSIWMQAADPMAAQAVTENVKSVKIGDLTTNANVRLPADADALATAPTFVNASMAEIEISREIIQGFGSFNKLQARQGIAGAMIDMAINSDIAQQMALQFDKKLRDEVAGLTYDTVNGAGNDNEITVGTAGSIYIGRAFPYTPSGTGAAALAYEGMRQAGLLLADKKVSIPQGRVLFGQELGGLVAIMPVPMADAVVTELGTKGLIRANTSVGLTTEQYRGIFGMEAYKGSAPLLNMEVLGDPSMPAPSGTDNWAFYVFPSSSLLKGAFAVIGESVTDYDENTTQHRYVRERDAIGLSGVKATRPAKFIKVIVEAD